MAPIFFRGFTTFTFVVVGLLTFSISDLFRTASRSQNKNVKMKKAFVDKLSEIKRNTAVPSMLSMPPMPPMPSVPRSIPSISDIPNLIQQTKNLLSFGPDVTTIDPHKVAFQYMSDLHLEVYLQYLTFDAYPTAPYLILAGDIGYVRHEELHQLLADICKHFEKVFYVLGNHEHYGTTYDNAVNIARKMAAKVAPNFFLLQQDRHRLTLPNTLTGRPHAGRLDSPSSVNGGPASDNADDSLRHIHILGCTLWSAIDPDHAEEIAQTVKDFDRIEDWTVEQHLARHASDVKWLHQELALIRPALRPQDRILVVTHHAPSVIGTSAPDKGGTSRSSAYATELVRSGDIAKDVAAWVYGHTHYTNVHRVAGTTLLSNQRGYKLVESDDESEKDVVDNVGFGEILTIRKETDIAKKKTERTKHRFNVQRTLWL